MTIETILNSDMSVAYITDCATSPVNCATSPVKCATSPVIYYQLLIANDRNRVRWLVLGLSQDGTCIDLYENHSENSLKRDLLNDNTVNPPLFSLVNTFKTV